MTTDKVASESDAKNKGLYTSIKKRYNETLNFLESNNGIIPAYAKENDYKTLICNKIYDNCINNQEHLAESIKQYINTGYIRKSTHEYYKIAPVVKIGQSFDGERRNRQYMQSTEAYIGFDKLIHTYFLIDKKGNVITDKQIAKILSSVYNVKFEKNNMDTEGNSDEKINLFAQEDCCPIIKGRTIEEKEKIIINLFEHIINKLQNCEDDFVIDPSLLRKHDDRIIQRDIINELKEKTLNPKNSGIVGMEVMCRMGKSHMTMKYCKEMNFKRVLITSNVVNSETAFRTDITKFSDYNNYVFYDQRSIVEDSIETLKKKLQSENIVIFVSLPFLKTDGDKTKQKKINLIFKDKFDIVVIDEFHSAGLTERTLKYVNTYVTKNVIQDEDDNIESILESVGKIKRDYTLICTATPENAVAAGILTKNNTVIFNEYAYLKAIKEDLSLDDRKLIELLQFPFVIYATFDPYIPISEIKKIPETENIFNMGVPFSFKEFSRYDYENERYVYYYYIKNLFEVLFCGKTPTLVTNLDSINGTFSLLDKDSIERLIKCKLKDSRYSQLDKVRKHIFSNLYNKNSNNLDCINKIRNNIMIYVDGVGQGKCIENILRDISEIEKNYIIINVAGDENCGSGQEAFEYIQQKIYESEQKGYRGYIIITCGKCITGTTISSLGTIIRFDNCQSLPAYIQTNLRCFSDCKDKKTGKYVKPYALVLDLNIDRCFNVAVNYIYSIYQENNNHELDDCDDLMEETIEKNAYIMGMPFNTGALYIKGAKPYYTFDEIKQLGYCRNIELEQLNKLATQNSFKKLSRNDILEKAKELGIDFESFDINEKFNIKIKPYDKSEDGMRDLEEEDKIGNSSIKKETEKSKSEKKKEKDEFARLNSLMIWCSSKIPLILFLLMGNKSEDSNINSIIKYKNNKSFIRLFNDFCNPMKFDKYIEAIENNKSTFLDKYQINMIITLFKNVYNSIKNDENLIQGFFSEMYETSRLGYTAVMVKEEVVKEMYEQFEK